MTLLALILAILIAALWFIQFTHEALRRRMNMPDPVTRARKAG